MSKTAAADRHSQGGFIAMNLCRYNPTLAEVLADPVTRAVMAADGVDARALARELREMAAALNPADAPPVAMAENARRFANARCLNN
ncbi:MAG TPA: hypothetical protein VGZ49_15245 [Xanthobacteraceae bacterium]|jgi:hypothetical protein|nr:hypothetical protein [Xanthobacteraceae bacterium]